MFYETFAFMLPDNVLCIIREHELLPDALIVLLDIGMMFCGKLCGSRIA